MVHFRLTIKESISYTDNWIIKPERIWINISCECSRNENFLLMFDIENKLLLNESLLEQNSLDVENVNELTDTEHELNLVKLILNNLLVVLVFQEHSV